MPNGALTADEKLWISFEDKKKILKDSKLYQEIVASIEQAGITKIRCLGLGSVTQSSLAMYQLCLLSLATEYYNKKSCSGEIDVSLWDPMFTAEDNSFLSRRLHYRITEDDSDEKTVDRTLFYMPHFPIKVLEEFITDVQPIYVLSNDLTVYSNKFTDSKYFDLYPNSARIAKMVTMKTNNREVETPLEDDIRQPTISNDGFEVVTKKKHRKKKNITKYTPAVVDYNFESAYFKAVSAEIMTEGNNLSNPWLSAFSDLCFYVLSTDSIYEQSKDSVSHVKSSV